MCNKDMNDFFEFLGFQEVMKKNDSLNSNSENKASETSCFISNLNNEDKTHGNEKEN